MNLPISRLINVDVILTPLAAQAQDLSTLLVLGNSDVIDVVERLRTYSTIDQVAADFGTTAPEYLSAVLWFEQAPQPFQLKVGRWAKTATKGKLVGAPLSAAAQLIATWNAVTTGSLKIQVDGGTLTSITGLNFAAAANLNAVAAIITAAITGAVCTYNSVFKRFEFESSTTGAASAVAFLQAGASGVDVSGAGFVNALAASSGAYVAGGIIAETALAAAALFDANFGQTWYALTIPEITVDADHVSVGGYIEACNNKHLYGISTQEGGVLSSISTTDVAFLVQAAKLTRTLTQYSSTNAYSVASLFGRALTVDYNGNNTVITLMYKQEPGIVAESLTQTQMTALEAKNCNVFVAYNNSTAIVEPGKMASGNFIDELTGTDWLSVTIMTALYNLLYTSPTKIPQTDAGSHLLVNTIEAVCSQALTNGLLGPGVWGSNGFGTLNSGDFLPKGFYVYAPPVALQNVSDRAARKSVSIQVAAKLAGAVHTVDVSINVSR